MITAIIQRKEIDEQAARLVARDLKLLRLKEEAYERTVQGRVYLEQILKD